MSRGRVAGLVTALLLVAASFLALVFALGVVASRYLGSPAQDGQAQAPRIVDEAPPVLVAGEESSGVPDAGDSGSELSAWREETAQLLGIPERVLRAYLDASAWAAEEFPECRLGWNTLAGIGAVESHHGTLGGASIDEDGFVVGEIIGPALDGSGDFALVEDTDGGELDGDPVYDRAVGPMQFLPETFSRYGVDGNGDGRADPNQIDDAAHSAANYLCAADRDLSTDEGWQRAILAYNASYDYVGRVHAEAARIAEAV
ncbi:lytic transglycosylase domain-containing protein [Sediminivirga luteola]|uniref:Transglycosylase SLT domain-containing protein n=1 Tax=Sediminivirga luteola TaxID=1774748 RepID=A0A8J2TX68_9MICO|nr:lytic murein transglycosylase [Sediminivirga luteola]GGA10484.1 hypothetical protein GCM10011333_11580 [Sediminivirga luteola]